MSESSTSQRSLRMGVPMKSTSTIKEEVAPQSSRQQFAAKVVGASLSNSYASIATNPFDVIKVRQQLRLNAAGGSAVVGNNTFWNVGREMVKAEGVTSLMHGVTATIMREVIYSGFRLGCYEFFKDKIHDASARTLSKDGITIKLAAASLGAAIGSIIANPTDLVKTRMQQAYPSGKLPYRHTYDAFAAVYRDGVVASSTGHSAVAGVKALWRGVDATTYRGIIVSASQISSYDQIKQSLKRRGVFEEGFQLHMVASVFAGFVSSVASNPIDVIKVRIHNDKEHRYRGVLHCIQSTMRSEGPLAFYKGFSMCWARIGVHTVLTFLAFERMRVLLGIKPM